MLLIQILQLIDSNLTSVNDVGVNFFLTLNDIGQPRATVIAPKLRELNPICVVTVSDLLDETQIRNHTALVVTQFLPLGELLKMNQFCRANHISFFYAFSGGVSADVFVDHGPHHVVNDFNGEKPIQKLITDITVLSDAEVLVRYDTPEGQLPLSLSSGHFEVSEVLGIHGINGAAYAVSRESSDPVKTVRMALTLAEGSKYLSGGLLTEKKLPTAYPMESLETKLKNPGNTFAEPPTLVLTDLINFGSEVQQHVAFYAVLTFASDRQRLPRPNDQVDAEAVLTLAKGLLADSSVALEDFELDEKFVLRCVVTFTCETD